MRGGMGLPGKGKDTCFSKTRGQTPLEILKADVCGREGREAGSVHTWQPLCSLCGRELC